MSSQITSFSTVCSAVCLGANQRKHQSFASLAFVRGIHRWPVNSPHKRPVTRKMFSFDDVTMARAWIRNHIPQKTGCDYWSMSQSQFICVSKRGSSRQFKYLGLPKTIDKAMWKAFDKTHTVYTIVLLKVHIIHTAYHCVYLRFIKLTLYTLYIIALLKVRKTHTVYIFVLLKIHKTHTV